MMNLGADRDKGYGGEMRMELTSFGKQIRILVRGTEGSLPRGFERTELLSGTECSCL